MELLGTIVKLQVQVTSLKVGERPYRRFDPAGIRDVPVLIVNPDGVEGRSSDGSMLDDVHNRLHPATKNRGSNPISIGFTAHYEAMRRRFGDHLLDGIAGENILVRSVQPDRQVPADALINGILIQTSADERAVLAEVIVAAPCVEFARYAMRFPDGAAPDRTVTESVIFLDDGTRGYYGQYNGAPIELRHGDLVYAL